MKAFIIAGAKCCRPKKILQIKQSNKKRHVDGGLTNNFFFYAADQRSCQQDILSCKVLQKVPYNRIWSRRKVDQYFIFGTKDQHLQLSDSRAAEASEEKTP